MHPGFGVATAWAYQNLARFPDALHGRPGRAENLVRLLNTLDLPAAAGELYNALEAPVLEKYPLLAICQDFLRQHGAAVALMSGSGSTIQPVSEAIIRIAGNSQDGIQAIGGFLARLAGRSEQEVMTFMTIPSTISGGPSIFQVRIGSGEVLSAGDEADVLLAFYQHSYEDHINSVKKGGIVLYDSDHVEPKPEWQKDYHHIGVPISGLTVEAIGGTAKDKGKNIYALGLIAQDVRSERAEADQAHRRTFHRQRPEHRQQRAGGVSCRLQPRAGRRDRNFPIRRKPEKRAAIRS
jgi:Pyruvate/2-oxoacid:ferredoxin oxidoreductase gamma subunit